MNDWLSTLGFAMGSAWLSGLNLYATVAILGLMQRFGFAHLPGDLAFLSSWWIVGLAGTLYVIQFIADKVPVVDSVWDTIHTFIRIPAGAVLAYAAFADANPGVKLAATLLGGGVALSSHGTKATARLTANMSPEPFSNILLSLFEDAVAIGSTILMVFHPVVILAIVMVFVLFALWFVPKIVRTFKKMFSPRRTAAAA
jgi:hypothetical protein